jgi:hypothetical protein
MRKNTLKIGRKDTDFSSVFASSLPQISTCKISGLSVCSRIVEKISREHPVFEGLL